MVRGRGKVRGLDAELAQLLENPDSIGYRKLRSRPPKRAWRRRAARQWSSRLPSPVFVAFLALTAAGGVLASAAPFGSRLSGVGVFVLVIAGWVVSVCLHEFAHAYIAYRGGDDGVAEAGYLRLNPFKYAHPLLSVVLPLVWIAYGGIGLPGGAVMIHQHRLRSRAWASAVSAAGPAVNIVIAVGSLAALWLFDQPVLVGAHSFTLYAAIGWFAWLQVSVAILNLLPIPGLDGWGIIEPWLSAETAHSVSKIKPFGLLVLVAILWIPSLSSAFSHLVDVVATALGEPTGLAWFGSELFRFWS